MNVLTGNFLYFDNNKEIITPEHVMASGALPPALPMVKIGTDHFWDGGIVSNTPLQHLLDQDDCVNTLVFQVDLFSARGALPRDILAHPLQHGRLSPHPHLENPAARHAAQGPRRPAER